MGSGSVLQAQPFRPSITEEPVKSLGNFFFDSSLRDAASIQATSLELDGWLKAVAHSELLGKFKA